jgi:hypothetical protein
LVSLGKERERERESQPRDVVGDEVKPGHVAGEPSEDAEGRR